MRNESSLEFQFSGPQAREAAQEMAEFLRGTFEDGSVRIIETPTQDGNNATRYAGDSWFWITLLLSLPSALLSSLQLAERFRLVERFRALNEWARARRARGQSVPRVRTPIPGQPFAARTYFLDELQIEQLIEALAPDVATATPPVNKSGESTGEH